jgi:hypothetical protein
MRMMHCSALLCLEVHNRHQNPSLAAAHPCPQWCIISSLIVLCGLRQLEAWHGQAAQAHVIVQPAQRLTTPPAATAGARQSIVQQQMMTLQDGVVASPAKGSRSRSLKGK